MKQILYRIKSLFLLVAIAGGISACADDKGNYNYHDIPEVKIEGIGNSITALAYQNLSIPVPMNTPIFHTNISHPTICFIS